MANNIEFNLQLAVQGFQKNLNSIDSQMSKFHKDFQKNTSTSNLAFGSFIGNLGANAISGGIAMLGKLKDSVLDFGIASLQEASKVEDLTTRFEVLTGSADEARGVMTKLQKFAATTPFQLEGLANTSAQLISFGFTADSIPEKLKRIGDVASASGSDIGDIGLIFGQVSAAGKLTGERLLQLQERGIPILDTLATQFGVTTAEMRDMITEGKVGFPDFEKAFNSLSDAGGPAFEGMIKQSKTFSGLLSTLGDAFKYVQSTIGDAVLPVAKEFTGEMIKLLTNLNPKDIRSFVTSGIVNLIEGFISLTEAVNPVVNSFKFLYNVGRVAFNGLVTGLKVIGIAFSEIESTILGVYSRILDALPDSVVPDGWKESLDNAKSTFDNFSEGLQEGLLTNVEETNTAMTDMVNSFDENIIGEDRLNAIKERASKLKDLVVESNRDAIKQLEKDNKKANKDSTKTDKDGLDAKASFYDTWKDYVTNFKSFEESTNSERVSNMKSTLGTISTLAESENKTLQGIGKAAAISTATIDGIVAVQKALASAPPPFNYALAATVGVATAANVAKIAGVKFADGGVVPGNAYAGDTVHAQLNSGELVLNKRQQANLYQIAEGGGSGNNAELLEAIKSLGDRISSMEIVMIADDNEIARATSRGSQNGVQIGRTR